MTSAPPRRVLFTGSRSYDDLHIVQVVLTGLVARTIAAGGGCHQEQLLVAHGAAQGLDSLVAKVVEESNSALIRAKPYPAAWERCVFDHPHVPCPRDGGTHRRPRKITHVASRWANESAYGDFCPLAGPRRNQDMLDDFKPELVMAFLDKPYNSSKGTRDMCERAAKAKVPIHIVTTGGRP